MECSLFFMGSWVEGWVLETQCLQYIQRAGWVEEKKTWEPQSKIV